MSVGRNQHIDFERAKQAFDNAFYPLPVLQRARRVKNHATPVMGCDQGPQLVLLSGEDLGKVLGQRGDPLSLLGVSRIPAHEMTVPLDPSAAPSSVHATSS